MPFSDKVREEVSKKAAFRCCRCQNIGVEVHHLIPEGKGGSNEIENAAPLCAKCHDDFGDNPNKKKQLTEMRDWWYEKAEMAFSPSGINPLLGKVNDIVLSIPEKQKEFQAKLVSELKAVLHEYVDIGDMSSPESLHEKIEGITAETSQVSSSGIVNMELPPHEVRAEAVVSIVDESLSVEKNQDDDLMR